MKRRSEARLQEAGEWVEVVVDGDLDSELLRRLTDDMLALVADHGVFGVLVDLERVVGTPPPSAIQRLPEYYTARNADPRLHVAIVLPARGDRLDLSRFYKLSAQRHAYRVNIHESRDTAVEWLRAQAH